MIDAGIMVNGGGRFWFSGMLCVTAISVEAAPSRRLAGAVLVPGDRRLVRKNGEKFIVDTQ